MMNNKYKILFVEDDSNIRTVITTLLETEGYQVIWAGTCKFAQGLFTSHQPDVVILDLGLPDMDAFSGICTPRFVDPHYCSIGSFQ